MINIKTLIQMIGGTPAALWKDWVALNTSMTDGLHAPDVAAMDDGEVEAVVNRRRQAAIAKRQGAVAVVPIRGVIIPRPNIFEAIGWATSVETIVSMTRAAVQDPDVKAVIQAYDSPGGSVFGVEEGFEELMALRGDTPIVAVAEHLMASAAYWLASAADEIVAAPSSLVGSIGVLMLHVEFSKALEDAGVNPTFIFAGEHKVEGNPYEPLDEEALAYFQGLVDHDYRQFSNAVAKARGVSAATVRGETFGQGRVLTSQDAKAAGMIDEVRTLRDTLIAYGITDSQSSESGSPWRTGNSRALAPQRRRRALALMEQEFQQ